MANDLNRAYVELLAEVDMSRVSNIKRDPVKVSNLLRSLARNTATMVDITALEKDIKQLENSDISRPTIYDYLDALNRLMIVEDQPAWNSYSFVFGFAEISETTFYRCFPCRSYVRCN